MQAHNTIEAMAAELEAARASLRINAGTTPDDASAGPPPAVPSVSVKFLSNLAHQLRSPLSSLRVWVDLLSDPAALANPDNMKRLVEGIDRATTRLERQITDVLEAGYLEAGTLTIETGPVDATEQVMLAISDTEQAARSRNIHIELDLGDQPALVTADAARMRQLMGCLLSNAIKFSPTGNKITVTAGSAGHIAGDSAATTILEPQFEGRSHYICVADSGPGIDTALHHDIFKPFYRATRKDAHGGGGSGLGLSIAAGLLKLLYGGMWLRSGLKTGAEFEFSLPQATAAPAADRMAEPE